MAQKVRYQYLCVWIPSYHYLLGTIIYLSGLYEVRNFFENFLQKRCGASAFISMFQVFDYNESNYDFCQYTSHVVNMYWLWGMAVGNSLMIYFTIGDCGKVETLGFFFHFVPRVGRCYLKMLSQKLLEIKLCW